MITRFGYRSEVWVIGSVEMIRNVVSLFSRTDVRIIECPAEYRFVIQFVGQYGIPPNMAGLIQAIEDIKPVHLTYNFKYTYTVWEMLKSLSWQSAIDGNKGNYLGRFIDSYSGSYNTIAENICNNNSSYGIYGGSTGNLIVNNMES